MVSGLQGCGGYSVSWDQHVKQLRDLLCRLQSAQLMVNLGKSEFCHACVLFLGYVVGQGQVAPVTTKVEAIHNTQG